MSTPLTAPLEACETALANDANYRSWCGATDVADAKANFIFTDDVIDADVAPQRFSCSSAVRLQITRIGEGSGNANFGLSDLRFELVFIETYDLGEDWTNARRVAFKNTIYGFIDNFVAAFEAAGMRLQSIADIEYNEDYTMHFVDSETGQKGYQMGWQIVSRNT